MWDTSPRLLGESLIRLETLRELILKIGGKLYLTVKN